MRRIMIIGCCGAGKSTLARNLHKITGLPLIHLDQHYWRPNWTEAPNEEWGPIVQQLASGEDWIIDGNYNRTIDIRLKRADAIIYLDISTWKCLYRVVTRIIKYHGQVRPDMPNGCKERFDLDFLHYVATFNFLKRKKILRMLEERQATHSVFVIRNNNDLDKILFSFQDEKLPKR